MSRDADQHPRWPREGDRRGGLLHFAHRAMACDWTFALHCDDAAYARQAVAAAAAEIDRLESELSRFVPSSDISRLNATPPGVPLLLGADALTILALAEKMRVATRGAFDVSIGALVQRDGKIVTTDAQRHGESCGHESVCPQCASQAVPNDAAEATDERLVAPAGPIAAPRVILDRTGRCATRVDADVLVDLGAIGKGFAVDAAVELLREWKIPGGFVTSGQSSVFAFGAPPEDMPEWRVALRDPRDHRRTLGEIALQDAALSGSGVALHGRHIIDPRTGGPANGPEGAWAVAPSGAISDAISTALMVLSGGTAKHCLEQLSDVAGFIFEPRNADCVIALTRDAATLLRS